MKKYSYIFSFSTATFFILVFLTSKMLWSDKLAGDTYGIAGLKNYPDSDIVMLGTSHVERSYDPFIIKDISNQSIYLISYPMLSTFTIEILLDDLIASNNLNNKKLIIDLYCWLFLVRPKLFSVDEFYHSTWNSKKKLLKIYKEQFQDVDFSFWTQLLISGYNEDFVTWPINRHIMNGAFERGMKKSNKKGLTQSEYKKMMPRKEYGLYSKIGFNKDEVTSLKRICEKLKLHGITPIFIETPFVDLIDQSEEVKKVKADLGEIIESFGGKYINLRGTFRSKFPDSDLFYDDNHFSTLGRAENSKIFAQMLLKGDIF